MKKFHVLFIVLCSLFLASCKHIKPPPGLDQFEFGGLNFKVSSTGSITASKDGVELAACGRECKVYNEALKVTDIETKNFNLGPIPFLNVTVLTSELPESHNHHASAADFLASPTVTDALQLASNHRCMIKTYLLSNGTKFDRKICLPN